MPWKETGPVLERMRFIEDYLSGCYTLTELASRYEVSRQTLHKWLARHDADGAKGLLDRSRRPLHSPQIVDQDVAERIIAFRRRFPLMGPRKIVARLSELHPEINWPAASTAGDILRRAGLVTARRRRNPPAHPLRTRAAPLEPNDLMTVDYKGEFLLGNHRYCYPLTVVDYISRFIFACAAFASTQYAHTRRAFEVVFREYGLPLAILSDNGSPFGSPGLARLSRLSLWWIRLGVRVERIVPGHPEQNGAHERMHRTLKAETTRHRNRPSIASKSVSTGSAITSTMSGRTRRLGRSGRLRSTGLPHGRIPRPCRRSSMPGTWRCERSTIPG